MSAHINSMKFFSTRLKISCFAAVLLIAMLPVDLPAAMPLSRKVLVFFDGAAGQSVQENIVFQDGQTILNYFGLLPDYRDVNDRPLPDDKTMSLYRGIITTFSAIINQDPETFLGWLNRQIDADRKVVVLGTLGAGATPDVAPELKKLVHKTYTNLGLKYGGDLTVSQPLIRFVDKDPNGVEFERKYPLFPESYEKFTPIDKNVKVYLSIQRIDRQKSFSAVIVTGPAGGFAHEDFIAWVDPVSFRRQWFLNPFKFFKESLGLSGLPTPDPTTLNGLRVAFSHIDADAFSGVSRIDNISLCAEVIRDQILKKFDFPVTVSVITGEIDPKAAGSPDLVQLAREIYKLPNVEPASHSYSHPFYWDPDYNNEDEKYEHQYGLLIPGYSHDPKIEIDASMQYITKELSPPEKPCKVFLWSGNCVPTESDIARCDALGYYNMNGGDTVFDEVNNSYTSVAPFYKKVGRRFQIFTGQANENILTNLWTGPYYGHRNIITTMQRTGSPRRIAPIDIYYHFYSAEHKSSLKAIQDVYNWVLNQDIAPIFTSDYLKMVKGYLKAKVYQDGPQHYVIRDYGDCLTVRFDTADRLPDLTRSVNVLGYTRFQGKLYVSLVPEQPEALVVMSGAAYKSELKDSRPYIKHATGWVNLFDLNKKHIKIEYSGFGKGWIEIAGLPKGTSVKVDGSSLSKSIQQVKTTDNGILTIDNVQTGNLKISWQ